MKTAHYAKAVTGAVVACLSYLQPVVDDGLTASEGIGAAVAFLSGLALVWAVPNRPRQRVTAGIKRSDPTGYGSGVEHNI